MIRKIALIGLLSSFVLAANINNNSIQKLGKYKIYQNENTFYDLTLANSKDLQFIPFKLPINDISIDIMKNSSNKIFLFKNNQLFMLIKGVNPVKESLNGLFTKLLKKYGQKRLIEAKIVLLNKNKGTLINKGFKNGTKFLKFYKKTVENPNTTNENNLLLTEIIFQKSKDIRVIDIYRTRYKWDKEKCPKCEMMQEDYRHLISHSDLIKIYASPAKGPLKKIRRQNELY